ncbi:MAG TPA: four helix bundle protein [Candidatus Magasanikbacteria bacterium]|nr:four helix bundle protein [Candidatus Magasanikbacteria bacterium]
MKIEKFEDIIAWQKAKQITIIIFKIFEPSRDYSFKDQIQRASVSIMNNIAEGFERRGDKEFKKFLFIAKGSCGEVRSMLDLAFSLKIIQQCDYDNCYQLSIEISRLLSGLIKALKD